MSEEVLLTGVLESTNEPYAIAKIAGIKLCESYKRQCGEAHGIDYRSVMPTNLYGPGDNFHPEHSHVLPALIRRFHEVAQSGANKVVIWGTGDPRREFLHVDDMAEAALFVRDLPPDVYQANTQPMLSHINVGTGVDISIVELARLVAEVTGLKAASSPTLPNPTGPRANYWMSRASPPWAGGPALACARALRPPTSGICQTWTKRVDKPE